MINTDDNIKALLFSQGLSDEAIGEWLEYYEEATSQGKNPEAASDYAWNKLKKKWQKADNGKWVKLEHGNWANDLMTNPNPIIEVFRAGEYPQGTMTIPDLDTMAQEYNPAIFEAPVTLDHNQSGPAFGWVRTIYRQGDRLFAVLRDLKDKFKEKVKSGDYRYRSIEIFELEYKGKRIWPYFKAVTFLGAKAPQVKGMAEPVFMCATGACFSIDIENVIGFPVDVTENSIRIRQRNTGDFQPNSFKTIALKGVKGVKAVIGKLKDKGTTTIQTYIFDKKEWTVDKAKAWVKEHGGKVNLAELESQYDSGGESVELTQEQMDAKLKEAADKAVAEFKAKNDLENKEAEFSSVKEENETLKKEIAEAKKTQQEHWAESKFEHLQSQGKLMPAEKGWFMAMMKVLSPDQAEIEFSSEIKGTPAKALVEFFNRMKARVEFKELTKADPNKDDNKGKKSPKTTQYANADELSVKRQEFIDEQMKDCKAEPGTPEWRMEFNAAFKLAQEEVTE